MSVSDSMDKVITYLAAVSKEKIVFRGSVYEPYNLRVSPLIFRGYTCPAKCGGCCPRFSLDYLPREKRPYKMKPRDIWINGHRYTIYSDMQDDRRGEHFCRNLNMTNGRCGVHESNPFSCDFELIRFHISQTEGPRPNQMTTRLFGRGWNMLRVDDERGAKCSMLPITDESRKETIRKLKRLKQWCEYFELEHKVDTILSWAKSNNTTEALIL